MTRACAVSRKKEQILRFVDAQKSVLAVDAYKRLGDYMLRNELGTTRPFGKSPKLNERETQRKNKPKIHEKYKAKSLANNCMNFDPPVPTE